MNIDKALAPHASALALRAQRSRLLAANLANADTPNYKARDMDFKAALGQTLKGGDISLQTTHRGHMSPGSGDGAEIQTYYRSAQQPSMDGNTVDTQVEQAQFTRNAIEYQASLRFMSGTIKGLLTAIRGE